MVEVVSGQRFDEYLREHIFLPLEMNDTSFVVPTDKMQRFAQLYKPIDDGLLEPASSFSSRRFVNQDNLYFSGGGGLCSTIDDYLQFCRMLLGQGRLGNAQILQSETLQQMFTNQLDSIERPPGRFQFGLGFAKSSRGDFAWGGAAGTRFWVNPEQQLAVIYMVQISPYGRRNHGDLVRDQAYRATAK